MALLGRAILSEANATLDGSEPLVPLVSPSQVQAAVTSIDVQALGATTAGMVRLFLRPPSGAISLRQEIPVTSETPSGTVQAFAVSFEPDFPIDVPAGYALLASTENAEDFAVYARDES